MTAWDDVMRTWVEAHADALRFVLACLERMELHEARAYFLRLAREWDDLAAQIAREQKG